jgi:hypothetical protein
MRSPTRFGWQITSSSKGKDAEIAPRKYPFESGRRDHLFNGDMGERLKPPDCESGDPG